MDHFLILIEEGCKVQLLLPAGGEDHVVRPLLPVGGWGRLSIVDLGAVLVCILMVLTTLLLPVGGEGHLCAIQLRALPNCTLVLY